MLAKGYRAILRDNEQLIARNNERTRRDSAHICKEWLNCGCQLCATVRFIMGRSIERRKR